jgi:hypothetical protein
VPTPAAYEIEVAVSLPEDCSDGLDNDFDGTADCRDADCFGPPECTVEVECGDGLDNDSDTEVDCDDADCAELPGCGSSLGVYEIIAAGDDMDLAGHVIVLIPDVASEGGYAHTVTAGLTGLPTAPGSGLASIELALGDTAFEKYNFVELTGLPFYGTRYSSLYIGSNGFLTFADGREPSFSTVEELFEQPIVAAFADDLDPSAGGTVTVDEFADRVVVTFEGVPHWGSGGENSFQATMNGDGRIELAFVAIAEPTAVVGISNGQGSAPYPAEVDFVP